MLRGGTKQLRSCTGFEFSVYQGTRESKVLDHVRFKGGTTWPWLTHVQDAEYRRRRVTGRGIGRQLNVLISKLNGEAARLQLHLKLILNRLPRSLDPSSAGDCESLVDLEIPPRFASWLERCAGPNQN